MELPRLDQTALNNSQQNGSINNNRTNENRYSKTCKPPETFKRGTDPKIWFTRFKLYTNERQTPDDQIFSTLMSFMDNENIEIVENSIAYNNCFNLAALEKAFVELYDDKVTNSTTLKNNFYSRKQLEGEGLIQYAAALTSLAKKAWQGIGSEDILLMEVKDTFINGILDESVRKTLKQHQPLTLQEAINEAKEINYVINDNLNLSTSIRSNQTSYNQRNNHQQNNQNSQMQNQNNTQNLMFTCSYCGVPGHPTLRCRKKAQDEQQTNLQQLHNIHNNN
jgi:hypothetical protein